MKKIFSIILILLIFIISGCQQKSDSNLESLTTLDSSMSLYEDDLGKTINLSNLTIFNGHYEDLVYTILSLPEHGNATISVSSDGVEAIYSPDSDFYGTDSFTYQVSNGELTSSGAITVRVKSHDDAPISRTTKLMTYENTKITFDLSSLVIDIDSEDLIYTIQSIPTNGLLEMNGSEISYTPNTNFTGDDEFEFCVYAGGNSSCSTVLIEVISKSELTE